MTKKSRKRLMGVLTAGVLLAVFVGGNCFLTTTHYTVEVPGLPAAFEGFRIALVADLHNHPWGSRLTGAISREQPDLIAVTGDLIDSKRTQTDVALAFIRDAAALAPVYYVTGNHEAWAQEKASGLLPALEAEGVQVLSDAWVTLEKQGESLRIAGVQDPAFRGSASMKAALRYVLEDAPCTILLSHRPEWLDAYVRNGAELVLTGHAHGGQFRLPWLGGLIAPDQGLLPELTEGVHRQGDTVMVISRGLGNSVIPLRLFNPPELVVVTLTAGV